MRGSVRFRVWRTETWLAPQRRHVERLWVAATLAWGLLRALIVWAALSRYGVNPWIYLAIELISSGPYGVATARIVTSLLDRRPDVAFRWALTATALFLAPDLYIVASGHAMPTYVYAVIAVVVFALGVAAVMRIKSAVRAARERALVARS